MTPINGRILESAEKIHYADGTEELVPAGEQPPGESDEERDFYRAEHLQQIPEFTRTHQLVYPYRSNADADHSQQLDASLRNGRLIFYGVEAQQLLTVGFVLTQNSTGRALHEEGPVPSHTACPSHPAPPHQRPPDPRSGTLWIERSGGRCAVPRGLRVTLRRSGPTQIAQGLTKRPGRDSSARSAQGVAQASPS
ncbi:hypothetical protein [Streptomyces sp. L-9-10]|uniref:hypothetical protein n=1 Tax=Streptomyces sp. L-9-10 TaxID=1478131 RepID=UPI00101CA22F|nr:hypothetical protein [Streptomyces sp. L-9-10]